MKSEHITVAHDERMQVGESAVWHPVEAALYWVDIDGKAVHRLHPASGKHSRWATPTSSPQPTSPCRRACGCSSTSPIAPRSRR